MFEYAGRDASMSFRGKGHTIAAIRALKNYEIGELPMKERIFRCPGKIQISDLPT